MRKSKTPAVELSGGYTSLMLRAEEGNLKEVNRILTEESVDVNAINKNGSTALSLAVKHGNYSIASALIKAGADANISNNSDQTPLFIACWHNYEDIVQLLLENEADINKTDQRGWTPLMISSYHGHRDIVRILVENRANTQAKDCFGKKALDRARDPAIIRLLESYEDPSEAKDRGASSIYVDPFSPKYSPKTRFSSTHASGLSKPGTSGAKPRLSTARDSSGSIYKVAGFLSPQNQSLGSSNTLSTKDVRNLRPLSRQVFHSRNKSEVKRSVSAERQRQQISPRKVTVPTIASPSKSTVSHQGQATTSPNLKRKFFKDEMQKLFTDHISFVSEKIQRLVEEKIALEAPVQVSKYEDILKKDIDNMMRQRSNELFNSIQSTLNIKLKFLLNKFGLEAHNHVLAPFEDEKLHIESLQFSQRPKIVDDRVLKDLEKDISKLEKSISFSKIPPQTSTTYDVSPSRPDHEIEFRSMSHKLQIKNEIIEQVNIEVRAQTDYLIDYSNSKVVETVRNETNLITKRILSEVTNNLTTLEEELKHKFENFINLRISEFADALSTKVQLQPKEMTPRRLSRSPSPKRSASLRKLRNDLDRVPEDREPLKEVQPYGNSRISARSPIHSQRKPHAFGHAREKIEQIKSSLNFMEEIDPNRPEKLLQRVEIEEKKPFEGRSSFKTNQPMWATSFSEKHEAPVRDQTTNNNTLNSSELEASKSRTKYDPSADAQSAKERIEELRAFYERKYAKSQKGDTGSNSKLGASTSQISIRSPPINERVKTSAASHRMHNVRMTLMEQF